jgi:ubiquinone/menaquinone biosynthesis C-methylase UbiE
MIQGRWKNNQHSIRVMQVFDNFVERYDAWFDSPFGKSAFEIERACIASLCRNLKGPSLEIGVGTGRFAEALGIEYGVDISVRALEYAKRRGIIVVRASGEELPFPDESFSSIFIIVTLCFVENPEKVLSEASRVLSKDGRIILGLILRESPWAQFYMKKGEEGNVFYRNAKFYSFNELEDMLMRNGLTIVNVCSTIFQKPTEEPLHFEPPRRGYYREAGFIAVEAGRKPPTSI